jgi:hypothetical protein
LKVDLGKVLLDSRLDDANGVVGEVVKIDAHFRGNGRSDVVMRVIGEEF